ncbi:MAG: FlgD immunoglobulin-like domain containing protein [bacterium]
MKKIVRINCMILLLLFLFTPFVSKSETYYVDCSHSQAGNANPGTSELPWLTIQYAAESVVAGDTVFIRAGTYYEHVYTDHGGDATGNIVFSAYPGEVPVLDGTGVTESQNGIVVDKSYIELSGLKIRNWSENAIWIENAAYLKISDCTVRDVVYGIGIADGSHDLVFNRVSAHHFDFYGFDVSPSGGSDCHDVTFNDCVAHTGRDTQQNVDGFALGHGSQHGFIFNRCCTYNVFDGFDISSRSTTLNCCLAYNCWNGGYKLWQDQVTLINCIGYNCDNSVVELDWDEQPGRTNFFNCTFFHSGTFTVWIENAADTLHMYNCILAGGENIGLAFEQRDAANYVGDYNLFHNDNAGRTVAVGYEDEFSIDQVESGEWTSYCGQDAHSVIVRNTADLFCDPIDYDLHLVKTSAAVDAGTDAGAPLQDYEGNQRPAGNGYDIGAFEYSASSNICLQRGSEDRPETTFLLNNFPNPFNPVTVIRYQLPWSAYSELKIYNIMGQKVRTLVKTEQSAGKKSVVWDGTDDRGRKVDSGLYTYTLRAGSSRETGKMLFLH